MFRKDRKNEQNQVLAELLMTAPRMAQIRRESLTIMTGTANPKTFWGRYDDLLFTLKQETEGALYGGLFSESAESRKETLKAAMEPIIKDFAQRCIEAGAGLKLKESLAAHEDKMTPELMAYLQEATAVYTQEV